MNQKRTLRLVLIWVAWSQTTGPSEHALERFAALSGTLIARERYRCVKRAKSATYDRRRAAIPNGCFSRFLKALSLTMNSETLSDFEHSSASQTPPLPRRDWLIATVLGRWYVVAFFAVFGGAAGFFSSHLMEPIYRAETVLVLVQTDGSGLGSLLGGGGLAALAGIQIPQIGDNDADAAIATLGSRNLATRLIESKNLLPSLFAEQWDATNGRWKDDAPTLNEALRLFGEHVRTIRRESGTVRLGIDWRDPAASADWANTLVSMANEVIREREIIEADKTILALSAEVDRASSVEVRAALYDLIEAQLKSKSAAAGREQFAFRVIDPAVAPDSDKPIWPRRSLLAALGVLMGSCVGIAAALFIARRNSA